LLSEDNNEYNNYDKSIVAISYRELGYTELSASIFNEILCDLAKVDLNEELCASIQVEAGKSFAKSGDTKKAKLSWEKALTYYSKDKDRYVEPYARTQANLGFLLLKDVDNEKQEEGIALIDESTKLKMLIGDIEGLANNHCNLGLYYLDNKNYQKSIIHLRQDMYLAKKIGDLRSLGSSLSNLSIAYITCMQLSAARKLLEEASELADQMDDENLKLIVNRNMLAVNKAGKNAGQNNEKVGPAAACACGSGKEYQECCGRADFEPVDIAWQFGGISQDEQMITSEYEGEGLDSSRLDFILRDTEESRQRFSWSRIAVHDGWMEMFEIPDMANHFLISAKTLAEGAKSDPESIANPKPLSALILSVCALESFINQVCFYLSDIKNYPEACLYCIPTELIDNPTGFQRSTELTQKWEILGKVLCHRNWPPNPTLWNDFRNLIYIRNELVHFKIGKFEQVVPEPKVPHYILKMIPQDVEIRKIPHAWPLRLLTPSFASWCVSVADSMIKNFREGYRTTRLEKKES
jgi:hypothetical protein